MSKPCWLMRQAGRYLPEYRKIREIAGSFLNLCNNPELTKTVTLQPLNRFKFDAAILFSDILIICQCFNQNLSFINGDGPQLSPKLSEQSIELMSDIITSNVFKNTYQAIDLIKSELPDKTTFIGFAGAPWTVATYMFEGTSNKDFLTTKLFYLKHKKLFSSFISKLTRATGDYLINQIDHGVEVIQLFDSWSGVLSESDFYEWVIIPTAEIVTRIRLERPGIPIIGFPRGCGINYKKFVIETKVDGISIDQFIPFDWAIKHLSPYCTIQGNLDPAVLIQGGTLLEHEVKKILSKSKDIPFIFNLGHGILPQTPINNVIELLNLIRN